ncbi:MAG TPA: VOC family protein [Methanomicrobiales archaeon]|nr:VOC family protein [Methanomicrobiales archaeon]
MPRVIHFDIPSQDPERLADFYRRIFGWEIRNWGVVDYWLATTGPDSEPGINGAIARRDPREGTRNTVSVANADETLKKIGEIGGKALSGKMAVPGVGYHALCQDPEGNVFGIMELDPAAKWTAEEEAIIRKGGRL